MFPFDDIGGNQSGESFPENYSVTEIIATAQESGLLGSDPLLRDTSDLRPFSQGFSYHFTGNAVDFGDDQGDGSPQQTALAAWIWLHFKLYTLELIHLNADGSYHAIKFGQDVDYSFYGDEEMQAHRNHVHWAITKEGLAQVQAFVFNLDVNVNVALDMANPTIRTLQGLLEARGGMIKPDNTSHPVLTTNVKWFQQQAGLTQDGLVGPTTSQRLLLPLHGK